MTTTAASAVMLRLPSATSAPATTSIGNAGMGSPSWAISTFAKTSVSPCSASRRVSASNALRGGESFPNDTELLVGFGLRLLLGLDVFAHLVHVERLRLCDDALETVRGQRAGLRVQDDLFAEDHDRGNRA